MPPNNEDRCESTHLPSCPNGVRRCAGLRGHEGNMHSNGYEDWIVIDETAQANRQAPLDSCPRCAAYERAFRTMRGRAEDGDTVGSVPASAWDIICKDRDEWKRRAMKAESSIALRELTEETERLGGYDAEFTEDVARTLGLMRHAEHRCPHCSEKFNVPGVMTMSVEDRRRLVHAAATANDSETPKGSENDVDVSTCTCRTCDDVRLGAVAAADWLSVGMFGRYTSRRLCGFVRLHAHFCLPSPRIVQEGRRAISDRHFRVQP